MDACDNIDIKSRRDRVDIAISCISTIFLCTWVAFHPNIPGPEEPKWKVFMRRIGCMIGGILAPEIYVLLAARQFIAPRHLKKKFRKEGWTLTHGFFALMGGFMVYHNETAVAIVLFDPDRVGDEAAFVRDFTSLEDLERRLAALPPESCKHSLPRQGSSHFAHSLAVLTYIQQTKPDAVKRGEQEHNLSIDQCIRQVEQYNHLSGEWDSIHYNYLHGTDNRHLLEGVLIFLHTYERDTMAGPLDERENTTPAPAMQNAIGRQELRPSPIMEASTTPTLVPRINEQDIQDKSKSDMLTKSIALFQVAWFILQLCTRYHENLVITELEIFTLAFCVLNFATYALWWKKPFAVDRGYAIRWRDCNWEVIAPPTHPCVKLTQVPCYRRKLATGALWWKKPFSATRGYATWRGDDNQEATVTAPLPSPLNKARQIPWNHRFRKWMNGPTNTDELAWRVCSICVTVLSVIVFLFDPLDDSFLGSIRWVMWAWKNKLLGRILFYGSSTAPLFYIMARIGLLLLVIRSLMYCPPSALEAVPWSQLIPHV
ncbi:hypothetical protein NLI96_g8858 [Meripilus lineatus]|uniref:Uncharacterized protein n=1 Tax=Meripilus lineatus TaxID=2056292 RepID=A0AAD5YDK9_9APHY|nr:hypothetical protein NLI96_g8858 [Physisporinus lineatus]